MAPGASGSMNGPEATREAGREVYHRSCANSHRSAAEERRGRAAARRVTWSPDTLTNAQIAFKVFSLIEAWRSPWPRAQPAKQLVEEKMMQHQALHNTALASKLHRGGGTQESVAA